MNIPRSSPRSNHRMVNNEMLVHLSKERLEKIHYNEKTNLIPIPLPVVEIEVESEEIVTLWVEVPQGYCSKFSA